MRIYRMEKKKVNNKKMMMRNKMKFLNRIKIKKLTGKIVNKLNKWSKGMKMKNNKKKMNKKR